MSQTNPKKGGNKGILTARREQRHENALLRAQERAQRSAEEQMKVLLTRPGNSARERNRLLAQQ